MDRPSDAILERLQALHPKLIDLSLKRIETLLERLGSPQDRLPPVIHVAGTNGKGSTIAFLRSILEAAGHSVHVYTSPHLVQFRERIVLAGEMISEEELAEVLGTCEQANSGEKITFFEITTAAAFLAFAQTDADMVLLETGLGGRLDATNLVKRPVLTAITPIAMDHMHFLGDTLKAIAFEKAAIQKQGIPSIIASQEDAARQIILETATAAGARPFVHGSDWQITEEPNGFKYSSRALTLHLPMPSLIGLHQLMNAGTAIACLEQIPSANVTDESIKEGLSNAVWPGRLQRLSEGRLVELLPYGWAIWLDGGHNPAAGAALATTISAWQDQPTHLVVGMMEAKQAAAFLGFLSPHVVSLRTIEIPGEAASAQAGKLAKAARIFGLKTETARDLKSAIESVVANEPGPARILVCGSLYLLGHIYDLNEHGGP
ncbi:MAG: bifunctional folylpolyglutamate synthase/dihydrofolate synthase [Alphaproteobacteria bacterium]